MLAPSADSFGQRRRQHLLGHEQARDFDHPSLQLIEPLRALRMIRYSGWVTGVGDQTFQRTFAHFLTDQYWFDEVNRLRDIVDSPVKRQVDDGRASAYEFRPVIR